jgi:hypothetical protein
VDNVLAAVLVDNVVPAVMAVDVAMVVEDHDVPPNNRQMF